MGWKPEYSLEQIELVCKDKDAWGPLFNKTSRPRDDDETVESLWSDWDIPRRMAEEEGREVIFTENTAPDREIWDEKGGLIKKGAAEIAERDQDHVPEVKMLTTLGMFAVPVTAETTIGEIRQKVQEWKPEYS